MNYIKKLECQLNDKSVEVIGLRSLLQDLREYLALPKFYAPNHYVNPDDILNRMSEGEQRTDQLMTEQNDLNIKKFGDY